MAQGDSPLVPFFLSQFVRLEVVADAQEVERHSEGIDYPGGPKGAVVTPEFAEKTAY